MHVLRCKAHAVLLGCLWSLNGLGAAHLQAQEATGELPPPTAVTRAKIDTLISEVLEPEVVLEIDPRRSKLIRTKAPVSRFSITDPNILDVVQFSPSEFELIGNQAGQTTLTLWFGGVGQEQRVLRYLVKVAIDRGDEARRRLEYGELQQMINEMFPNSMVQLIPIADKLIVRGQARDAEEASQIMSVLRGQAVNQDGALLGPGSYGFNPLVQGTAAEPFPGSDDLPASQVVNMLTVPGEQQVMLKVRIAELSRSALREIGARFSAQAGDFSFASDLAVAGAFTAVLDTTDVQLSLAAISSNGYSKILAEPNLVTLSGRPANFIAGGEFAVPTVVGVDGVEAATTSFRAFGTLVAFTPTVLDKDRIRLQVSPTFSTLNESATVNGIPGLNIRTVDTTVDLREGQWLAIAGLIQDQQSGGKARIPYIGDIPILDTIFSRKNATREETELLVLVSPELVHPMEQDVTPLVLPGMEVTEPNDCDFFFHGLYEGRPDCHHRSTVWPIQQTRIREAQHAAVAEAKQEARYRKSEGYFVRGPHGFSR